MTRFVLNAIAIVAVLAMSTFSLAPSAQQTQAEPHPLAGFERLIGGRWHLGNSYQEFEWGVGRRSVKARSYFVVDGKPRLVSEGTWYWHPAEASIRGVFTAVDMPVDLFEYTSRFDGADLVSDLIAYSGAVETAYVERWAFVDEAQFEWTLYAVTADGPQREMGGTYTRQNADAIETDSGR